MKVNFCKCKIRIHLTEKGLGSLKRIQNENSRYPSRQDSGDNFLVKHVRPREHHHKSGLTWNLLHLFNYVTIGNNKAARIYYKAGSYDRRKRRRR